MLGALSAVFGIASSIGGFASSSAATAATNKQRLIEWQMQQHDYLSKGFDAYSRYNMKKAQYSAQLQYNKEGYFKTVFAGDRKSEQLGRQQMYADERARTQLTQALGAQQASGQTGVSAGRMRGAMMAEFGRNQQLAQENLISKRQDIMIQRDSAYRQMIKANQDAYSNVYVAPQHAPPPPAPVMQPGPNPLTLIGGIGNALVGGYQTYLDNKPPGQ